MSNAADQTLIDPSDGDDIVHSRNRIWMGWIVVVILVGLAFTNARSLERWAASQPPNWSTETVRLMAELWTQRMQTAGFNAPRDYLHGRFERLKSTTWPDVFGTPQINRSSPITQALKEPATDFSGHSNLGAQGRECAQVRCYRGLW